MAMRLWHHLLHRDHVCPWWFCPAFDNPLRRLLQPADAVLQGLVSTGQTVADVGCGMGYFTIPLARLVGPGGRVIAVDLQEQMLAGVRRRAEQAAVLDRVTLRQCTRASLGLAEPVDFALAFWMAHEVPDQDRFFRELAAALKPGGRLLVVEPLVHVSGPKAQAAFDRARAQGLALAATPKVRFSRAALFSKP